MMTPARWITGIFLAAGIFLAGYMANRQNDPTTSSAAAIPSIKYTCPMHPQYASDHSGTCPVCGMSLVRADENGAHDASNAAVSEASGMLRIDSEKQQLIGVRTDNVSQNSASNLLRVAGRIAVDEGRLSRLIAATDGWIRELGENPAGTHVRKNQVLASYYSRDLLSSAQTFMFALQTNAQVERGDAVIGPTRPPTQLTLQVALDSLRALGMSEFQIEEIKRNRVAPDKIHIYSPIDGYVIARNISPQQRFDKGSEMYRIADVSHVWVMTDIFEKDREFLGPRAIATVRYRDRQFRARMSDALPQFDPASRTLKTRFEMDNPGSLLLPDMFVDVELHVDKPAAMTVPADAVIDSGLRKMVYVERAAGMFEPRMVETGWRLGNRVQVTRGLNPGERIVVSGNFLLDSESRMRFVDDKKPSGTAEKSKMAKDFVCGMDVDPKSPDTLKSQYKGTTYYFCGPMCKKSFDANPEKFIQKTTAPKVEKAKDPVCGMDVDAAKDTPKSEYKGQTYYFCSEHCKKSFDANPEKYVHKGMAGQGMSGKGMPQ
jgi:membrane fusion protein, copper/silver efflux system